ncbi:hypothetical protein [Thiomicrorhabdus sp.]|uniref:hypothetical protein n=1 Tax=Thiomicrorhabdus sp. TaxID=2039724 RepID=UPI0029C7FBFA|nr:hypothetical protein [Thiomicrorhabdus sp.]
MRHYMNRFFRLATFPLIATMAACSNSEQTQIQIPLLDNHVQNTEAAYIPLQCYTKTQGMNDKIHNPCFSCHTPGKIPNYLDDSEFQMLYDFRETTRKNPWINAFKDRTNVVAQISDEQMQSYVQTSNYFDQHGNLTLAETLTKALPDEWDFNHDGQWEGYVPDIYFNFDNEGFDRNPNGADTGWRAFAYYPFLGTFWPTNGSSNDVIIRLAPEYQQDKQGQYSREIYKLNLAITEAMIREKNIPIKETDETLYQVDLNKNGRLDKATEIVYNWAPLEQRFMSYVGKAKELFDSKEITMAAGLYPMGTEFVHTVRYVDVDQNGKLTLAKRIKELRYAKKYSWNTYFQLRNAVMAEEKEAVGFPERLRTIKGNAETGVSNNQGWVYQGFIEDRKGSLRPQSYEESLTCVGCHSGVGATTDSSFAFPRKLNADKFQHGWYHWTQKYIQKLPEPQWLDGTYEYSKYLVENHSGNEFRNNDEVQNKFFDKNDQLKQSEIERLHQDISLLLAPSRERAMQLNKAYKVIVDEQSFIYGRDAHVKPLENVWDVVPEEELTGVKEPVIRQPLR